MGYQMNPDRVDREMGEVVTLGMCKPLSQAIRGYGLENEQTVRLMIKYVNRGATFWGGDV
jgi:hypothetical protein